MKKLLWLLSAFLISISAAQTLDINFSIFSGANLNYFIRDNTTAATLLLTARNASAPGKPQRMVVGMPAGNSGALSYFIPADNSTQLVLELVEGSLQTVAADNNHTGLAGAFTMNANATLGVTIIGSLRAVRDYVEGSGTMHESGSGMTQEIERTEALISRCLSLQLYGYK